METPPNNDALVLSNVTKTLNRRSFSQVLTSAAAGTFLAATASPAGAETVSSTLNASESVTRLQNLKYTSSKNIQTFDELFRIAMVRMMVSRARYKDSYFPSSKNYLKKGQIRKDTFDFEQGNIQFIPNTLEPLNSSIGSLSTMYVFNDMDVAQQVKTPETSFVHTTTTTSSVVRTWGGIADPHEKNIIPYESAPFTDQSYDLTPDKDNVPYGVRDYLSQWTKKWEQADSSPSWDLANSVLHVNPYGFGDLAGGKLEVKKAIGNGKLSGIASVDTQRQQSQSTITETKFIVGSQSFPLAPHTGVTLVSKVVTLNLTCDIAVDYKINEGQLTFHFGDGSSLPMKITDIISDEFWRQEGVNKAELIDGSYWAKHDINRAPFESMLGGCVPEVSSLGPDQKSLRQQFTLKSENSSISYLDVRDLSQEEFEQLDKDSDIITPDQPGLQT